MADTYTPIRTALADAFLGDTNQAKDLFPGSPQTFDQRILDLLNGLGQLDPALLAGAISGGDVAGLLREIHATSQAERLAFIQAVRASLLPPSCEVAGSHVRVATRLGAPGPGRFLLDAPLASAVGEAVLHCSKTSADTFVLSGSGFIQPPYTPKTDLAFLEEYTILFPAFDSSLCVNELLIRIGSGGQQAHFQIHNGIEVSDAAHVVNDFYRAVAPTCILGNVIGHLAFHARGPFFPWKDFNDPDLPIPNRFEFSASISLPPE